MSGIPDGLWLYDGHCVFCSRSVQLALRADRSGQLKFTALQSPYGQWLAGEYGIDRVDPETFLLFDAGKPLQSSDAVLALARRLPAPYRWISILRVVPKYWRDQAYLMLARHRYRLFGRAERCIVPSPSQLSRFLVEAPSTVPKAHI